MRDPNIPENAPIHFRLQSAMLGGGGPKEVAGKNSKTAKLANLGWRILPVPDFWPARQLFDDGKGGGNPAFICFRSPRDWLVIPPDASAFPARKFLGQRAAIQWAWQLADHDKALGV